MRAPLYCLLFLLAVVTYLPASDARASLAAQIANISDLNLPTWGIGDPDVNQHIDVCVYAIGIFSTSYGVTISSPGGYVLSNGSNTIPYSLYWEDSGAGNLGTTGGTQLTNNVKLTGRMNANILSPLCALGLSGPTARLTIKITQADMTAALAGTYNGTITLLISPN
jgi:hypothetical protein